VQRQSKKQTQQNKTTNFAVLHDKVDTQDHLVCQQSITLILMFTEIQYLKLQNNVKVLKNLYLLPDLRHNLSL
jgi:hypothetical protein